MVRHHAVAYDDYSRFLVSSSIEYGPRRQVIADRVEIRILPLGDSITWGEGSTNGNGYRLALADLLEKDGIKLEYIGRVKSGTMPNNEHEGHGGYDIAAVGAEGKPDYPERPTVILLMAGTNDIVFDVDVDDAPARLGNVIGDIATACPDATILVATLPPLLDAQWSIKVKEFNSAIVDVVRGFTTKRKKVALVAMDRVASSHINATDGIHPTEEGYEAIAAAWHSGIIDVHGKGWIQKPLPRAQQDPMEITSGYSDKSPYIDLHSQRGDDGLVLESSWAPVYFMVRMLMLLGLVFVGRRLVIVLIQKYRNRNA